MVVAILKIMKCFKVDTENALSKLVYLTLLALDLNSGSIWLRCWAKLACVHPT